MKTRACSLLVVGVSVAALCGCTNMQNRSRGTSPGTAAQAPAPPPPYLNSGPTQLDLNAPLAPPPPPSAGGFSSADELSISTGSGIASTPEISEDKISTPVKKTADSKPASKPASKSKPYNMAKKSEPTKKTETVAKKSEPVPAQNKTIAKLAILSGSKPKSDTPSTTAPAAKTAPEADTSGDDMLGLPVRKNENSDASPQGNRHVVPVSNPEPVASVNTKNVI